MPVLEEFIRNLPEILKAASATDLSLAAFVFLLGVGVIAYLMKDSAPGWRFGSILLWLLTTLLVLYFLVGPLPTSGHYSLQLEEEDATERGSQFRLDLGSVAAGSRHAVGLYLKAHIRPSLFRIDNVDDPLEMRWGVDGDTAELSETTWTRMNLALDAPSQPGTKSRRQIVIRAVANRRPPPLTIFVHYQTLEPTVTVGASSGPRASGRGQDYSGIYSVCTTPPSTGDYIVESSSERLSGDRSCGAWATCTPRITPDRKSACLDFTLQGHSECLGPFANCDPSPASEGHVRATYRLRQATPVLSSLQG